MKSVELFAFDKAVEQTEACRIVGTDEVGRGPLAGPVIAAAVVLDLDNPLCGINDSKKLSAGRRNELYDEITNRAVAWSVGSASVEEIDRINILQASLLAMKRAIEGVVAAWSLVLVDGNKIIPGINAARQRAIVKGDGTSASIAAASIVAKVTRDRLMEQYHSQYPQYGFAAHKGYPTEEHRRLLVRYGVSPIHRRSFCAAILQQTTLVFDT